MIAFVWDYLRGLFFVTLAGLYLTGLIFGAGFLIDWMIHVG